MELLVKMIKALKDSKTNACCCVEAIEERKKEM